MDSAKDKILKKILEKSNPSTGMYIKKVYKDTLRFLISIFGDVYYIDKDNNSIRVKCFHANQERAVAKATVGDNITLPVITISENQSVRLSDTKRGKYSPLLVNKSYWDPEQNRAIRILSLAPRPVNIDYSINIWAKYKEDLDQIRETISAMFNPDLEVETKYSQITKCFVTDETSDSILNPDDTEDRVLKTKLNIRVETYIPSPEFLYTSTGKIEQLKTEIEIIDTSGTLI